MIPKLISGGSYKDDRGELNYNNSFDLSQIKRIYTIVNKDTSFKRRWQGHKIEQRWFTAIKGELEIQLIKIDNWVTPDKELVRVTFKLTDENLDVLHIPAGYISSIESFTEEAKLLVMSDYKTGDIIDDYKYLTDYFIE